MRKEKFIESYDGTKIWYSEVGSGDIAMVPANGILCTTTFWRSYEDRFKDRFRFITWDYRGHGRSQLPKNFDACMISDYAKDLEAVLADARVKKAILFGHSMGCQVIVEYTRNHPERVAGLIPICGPYEKPFSAISPNPLFEKIMMPLFDIWSAQGNAIGVWMRPLLRSPLAVPVATRIGAHRDYCPKDLMEIYFDHIAQLDLKFAFRAFKNIQLHTSEDFLPSITAPTLVVAGERDKMTPLKLTRRFHELIPGSEFLSLPEGEHTALIEFPEVIGERIEKWLKKNFGEYLKSKGRKSAKSKKSPVKKSAPKKAEAKPAAKPKSKAAAKKSTTRGGSAAKPAAGTKTVKPRSTAKKTIAKKKTGK